MRIPERRKMLLRRRLFDIALVLSLYSHKNKDPKEIAFIITQKQKRIRSAWWVRKQIRTFTRLL